MSFKSIILCVCLSLYCFSSMAAEESRYKMYCMYTPDFEPLFKEFFVPNLKDDFEVIATLCTQDCPSGTYRSKGWDRTMLKKLKVLKRAILENWNDVFFYSDIDIIFLQPILESALNCLGDKDFVVQQSWPNEKLCAGFFVMRGNEKTLALIKKAYRLLERKICPDDQDAIQKVLDKAPPQAMAWGFLPPDQYPIGRWVLGEAPKKAVQVLYEPGASVQVNSSMRLFHASCCIGLQNKCHFLHCVQEAFVSQYQKEEKKHE